MFLTAAHFSDKVGDAFVLPGDPGPVTLHLVEVEDFSDNLRDARGQKVHGTSFSLLFHGPADRPLPQRTYAVEYPGMDPMGLFLVPVGQDDQGFLYESIFNNPTPPEATSNR